MDVSFAPAQTSAYEKLEHPASGYPVVGVAVQLIIADAAFRECNIPIVPVVQGRALGFGCALAALSDITLAADNATFQIPEMNRKILPTMVMWALSSRVPAKQMQYLVFTRVRISAERALALDIVNETVPAAFLDTRLAEVLAGLSVVPKAALLGVKEYARSAYDMPNRGALDFARNLHATVNSSVSELRIGCGRSGRSELVGQSGRAV